MHDLGPEVFELNNEGVYVIGGGSGHVVPSREKVVMGQRFRRGIRKVVEFVGRIAVKNTDGVRAGFDILKE